MSLVALLLPWAAAGLRAALRVGPAVWLLPPLARSLPGPLRVAAAGVLALPVVATNARAPLPPWTSGAGWWVVGLRELLAGCVLAAVLAAPWGVLVGVGRVVESATGLGGGVSEGEGPAARLALGVGGVTLLGLGAHRGIVRAVVASQGVFPGGGDPAAPWALDAALGSVLRSLTLATAAVVELSAAAVVAGIAAAVAGSLGGRLSPATQGLGASLRAAVVLGVFGLSLDRVAAGAAALAARVAGG